MRRANWSVTAVALTLVSIGVEACGGGSGPPGGGTSRSTSAQAASPSAPHIVVTRRLRAALYGANHDPVARGNWTYTVTASDSAGHPLGGTVLSQFVFAGQVVGRETPPDHRLANGRLHDVMQFPAQSVGVPLTFQAVVRTRLGTVTLGWPVMVRR